MVPMGRWVQGAGCHLAKVLFGVAPLGMLLFAQETCFAAMHLQIGSGQALFAPQECRVPASPPFVTADAADGARSAPDPVQHLEAR